MIAVLLIVCISLEISLLAKTLYVATVADIFTILFHRLISFELVDRLLIEDLGVIVAVERLTVEVGVLADHSVGHLGEDEDQGERYGMIKIGVDAIYFFLVKTFKLGGALFSQNLQQILFILSRTCCNL